MKLTKNRALELLEEGRDMNPGRWIEHSKRVGEAAARIAFILNLDVDKATIMGYIHDIGKRFGKSSIHQVSGYEFLKGLGVDEEICAICITHSYLNGTIDMTAGANPLLSREDYHFRIEYLLKHSYTIYDKIINLCDLMCTSKFVTIEKRLIDIYSRRGIYENTYNHLKEVLKLKKEIESMIGANLYSLFPEIEIV